MLYDSIYWDLRWVFWFLGLGWHISGSGQWSCTLQEFVSDSVITRSQGSIEPSAWNCISRGSCLLISLDLVLD
ncbi:hypothetical protein BDW71DRAFT_188368 [Aspergillus fruticulosus]